MAANRYELENSHWERIKDIFPSAAVGRPPKDHRIMFNAIVHHVHSGAAWRDLPERYGPWKSVYWRFCKWRDDGTLQRVFEALTADADFENLSMDSTFVKAHPHSAGAKKGAPNAEASQHIGVSRGGKTTKIHAIVDGLGNPVLLMLTGGQVADGAMAIAMLRQLPIAGSNVIADKAYGSAEIRDYIASRGASCTTPPKSNAKEPWEYDKWLYRERHLVECFFRKLKDFRRVATRYDKLATSFLAVVQVASICILLR